jgi:mono/diheme cytochrome c family protein
VKIAKGKLKMKFKGLALAILLIIGAQNLNIALAQAQSPTTPISLYSEAQAARGAVAYQAHCAACHGVQLNGIDTAPSLVSPQFIGSWKGQSVAKLIVRIRSTMPANAPGTLGTSMVEDISAFILKENQVQAGSNEMPKDMKSLQGLTLP